MPRPIQPVAGVKQQAEHPEHGGGRPQDTADLRESGRPVEDEEAGDGPGGACAGTGRPPAAI